MRLISLLMKCTNTVILKVKVRKIFLMTPTNDFFTVMLHALAMQMHALVGYSMHWRKTISQKIRLLYCGEIMDGNLAIIRVGVSIQTLSVTLVCH